MLFSNRDECGLLKRRYMGAYVWRFDFVTTHDSVALLLYGTSRMGHGFSFRPLQHQHHCIVSAVSGLIVVWGTAWLAHPCTCFYPILTRAASISALVLSGALHRPQRLENQPNLVVRRQYFCSTSCRREFTYWFQTMIMILRGVAGSWCHGSRTGVCKQLQLMVDKCVFQFSAIQIKNIQHACYSLASLKTSPTLTNSLPSRPFLHHCCPDRKSPTTTLEPRSALVTFANARGCRPDLMMDQPMSH